MAAQMNSLNVPVLSSYISWNGNWTTVERTGEDEVYRLRETSEAGASLSIRFAATTHMAIFGALPPISPPQRPSPESRYMVTDGSQAIREETFTVGASQRGSRWLYDQFFFGLDGVPIIQNGSITITNLVEGGILSVNWIYLESPSQGPPPRLLDAPTGVMSDPSGGIPGVGGTEVAPRETVTVGVEKGNIVLSGGSLGGIIAGSVLGSALLVGLIVGLLWWRVIKRRKEGQPKESNPPTDQSPGPMISTNTNPISPFDAHSHFAASSTDINSPKTQGRADGSHLPLTTTTAGPYTSTFNTSMYTTQVEDDSRRDFLSRSATLLSSQAPLSSSQVAPRSVVGSEDSPPDYFSQGGQDLSSPRHRSEKGS